MSKPYPKYKDSGVERLGNVPVHWETGPLKRYMKLRYGDALAADSREDGEVKVFGSNGIVGLHSKANTAQPAIIVGRKGSFGKIVWAESGGFVIDTAYSIDCQTTDQLLRWAYYMLQLLGLDQFSQDTGVPGLARESAYELEIVVPPVGEQASIATFLDHETAKIDALVEEQRRLIELLKEKRQAIISHAVTRGLNPNAPMKDSGIEWLGEVPEHWEVVALKRIWSIVDCKHVTADFVDDGIPLASIREVQSKFVNLQDAKQTTRSFYDQLIEGGRLPSPGDLIFSRNATVGEVAQVGSWHPPFAMGQDVCLLRKQQAGLSTDYFQHIMKSKIVGDQLEGLMIGSTFKRINVEELRNLIVPFPPAAEQMEIATHLDSLTDELDDLISEATSAISLLHERRAALISAAVTGKIDVRPSAEVVSFPVNRTRVRGLVATEIIERLSGNKTFGRVKLQKLAYLAEAHAGVSELDGNYSRMAAGPLDRDMVDEMEREAGSICGVSIEQPSGIGTTVTYRTTGPKKRHSAELFQFLGSDRSEKLNKLIVDFTDTSTRGTEAIATLYAVWNDALIDGKTPSDGDIVSGFLNDWHPEKRKKFKDSDELYTWLGWMRRHGLVPEGKHPKTSTGRFFP